MKRDWVSRYIISHIRARRIEGEEMIRCCIHLPFYAVDDTVGEPIGYFEC